MYNYNDIFNFIVSYKIANDGNSPTIREIQRGCDISSTSVANYILDSLEVDGKIERADDKSRGIHVVGGSWTYKPKEVVSIEHTD